MKESFSLWLSFLPSGQLKSFEFNFRLRSWLTRNLRTVNDPSLIFTLNKTVRIRWTVIIFRKQSNGFDYRDFQFRTPLKISQKKLLLYSWIFFASVHLIEFWRSWTVRKVAHEISSSFTAWISSFDSNWKLKIFSNNSSSLRCMTWRSLISFSIEFFNCAESPLLFLVFKMMLTQHYQSDYKLSNRPEMFHRSSL